MNILGAGDENRTRVLSLGSGDNGTYSGSLVPDQTINLGATSYVLFIRALHGHHDKPPERYESRQVRMSTTTAAFPISQHKARHSLRGFPKVCDNALVMATK